MATVKPKASPKSMAGRIGAHTRWAHTPDRKAATAPARKGFLAKFEKEVDPEGVLPPEVRDLLAHNAMRAHMTRLAMEREKKRAEKALAAAAA